MLSSEFALCDPVAPEPPSGVAVRHARFSASQLNTYAECPRKWFYRYICAAVEEPGSDASFYGTAFHAALERLHHEFPEPAKADPREVEQKLQGYLNAAFVQHRNNFENAVALELSLRRARRTGKKYVQWLLAQARQAPFSVIGCELAAELQLDGFNFIGYIDRLDRDDETGAVSVLDYKTGNIPTSAEEYLRKVREFKDFQLPFYYWARTQLGDRVWRLALVPLKDALLDVRPVVLEVVPMPTGGGRNGDARGTIGIAELERARVRMIDICRELVAGTTTAFAPAKGPEACTYCSYQVSCSGKPHASENRFAR